MASKAVGVRDSLMVMHTWNLSEIGLSNKSYSLWATAPVAHRPFKSPYIFSQNIEFRLSQRYG